MKRFLINAFIFTSPIIIYFTIPSLLLWKSKENFYRIEKVLSGSDPYLIGYAYNENNYGFIKWANLQFGDKKSIWAVGSSRVLQFRKNMFDSSFYNAGSTISSINDFRPFIKSIPHSKHPKFIIISLDQWMFNEFYDSLHTTPTIESWQNSYSFFPKLLPTYTTVYTHLFDGKYSFASLMNDTEPRKKIGMNAMMNNTGFRNDGSFLYGEQIKKLLSNDSTANDFKYSDTFDRIRKGNKRFQYCPSVNKKALVELNELLKYCKDKQINVIAFLPPFADSVYNKMSESNHYFYLKEIYSCAKPIFDKYHFEIHNFSSMSLCHSNDSETIDGFHGGEVTYQKLLINMLENGSVLNEVANVKRLKNDLKNKKNNYAIYDN